MSDRPDALTRLIAIRAHLRQVCVKLDALRTVAPDLPSVVTHDTLRTLTGDSTTWLLEQLAQLTRDSDREDPDEGHREGRT